MLLFIMSKDVGDRQPVHIICLKTEKVDLFVATLRSWMRSDLLISRLCLIKPVISESLLFQTGWFRQGERLLRWGPPLGRLWPIGLCAPSKRILVAKVECPPSTKDT